MRVVVAAVHTRASSVGGWGDNTVDAVWLNEKREQSSGLAAEAHMIVGIEVIHDRVQIGARRIESPDLGSEPFEVLGITERHGLQPGGPRPDFVRRALRICVGVHPKQDGPIARLRPCLFYDGLATSANSCGTQDRHSPLAGKI